VGGAGGGGAHGKGPPCRLGVGADDDGVGLLAGFDCPRVRKHHVELRGHKHTSLSTSKPPFSLPRTDSKLVNPCLCVFAARVCLCLCICVNFPVSVPVCLAVWQCGPRLCVCRCLSARAHVFGSLVPSFADYRAPLHDATEESMALNATILPEGSVGQGGSLAVEGGEGIGEGGSAPSLRTHRPTAVSRSHGRRRNGGAGADALFVRSLSVLVCSRTGMHRVSVFQCGVCRAEREDRVLIGDGVVGDEAVV
jgi:hypothetical protein